MRITAAADIIVVAPSRFALVAVALGGAAMVILCYAGRWYRLELLLY
jgi:hypothetical protein